MHPARDITRSPYLLLAAWELQVVATPNCPSLPGLLAAGSRVLVI